MSDVDLVQRILSAYSQQDFEAVDILMAAGDDEDRAAAWQMIAAGQEVLHARQDRKLAALAFLAQHRPNMPIGEGIADLDDDELEQFKRTMEGDDDPA